MDWNTIFSTKGLLLLLLLLQQEEEEEQAACRQAKEQLREGKREGKREGGEEGKRVVEVGTAGREATETLDEVLSGWKGKHNRAARKTTHTHIQPHTPTHTRTHPSSFAPFSLFLLCPRAERAAHAGEVGQLKHADPRIKQRALTGLGRVVAPVGEVQLDTL